MNQLYIRGGRTLEGEVRVQGAKNSVLPILAATLLTRGQVRLEGCPRLRDVDASIRILRDLGCSARWEEDTLAVDTAACPPVRAATLRASSLAPPTCPERRGTTNRPASSTLTTAGSENLSRTWGAMARTAIPAAPTNTRASARAQAQAVDGVLQLRLQRGQVASQSGQTVKGGIVQTFLDPGQLHPEGPVIENVLQPVHLRPAVIAVAALRHPAGLQQANLVVPAQGAGGHPGQARQFLNGILHKHPSMRIGYQLTERQSQVEISEFFDLPLQPL